MRHLKTLLEQPTRGAERRNASARVRASISPLASRRQAPSSFCAPSPRRGRRPANLWSVFLSASVRLAVAQARTHAVFGVVVERHNRSVVEAPLSSRKTHPVFGVGEVEANRCVNTFGSLLIVVFPPFKKPQRPVSFKHQFFAVTPRQRLALLFTRPFVGPD